MSDKSEKCQFSMYDLYHASSPIRAFILQGNIYALKMHLLKRKSLFSFIKTIMLRVRFGALSIIPKQKKPRKPKKSSRPYKALRLHPGELVEVLSEEKIQSTLDSKARLRGLVFMPEMRKYCGKQFRVYKRLERIILESTGEIRSIKDTVLLEGVVCSGEDHFGCDRSCYCFWREAWLKRVNS
ncbi:MAG: hypothetical protein JSV51_05520 [Candidatus Bathyarchaeota archaeon]|nr:MAG: hypothetical protein JSV51_05520 [Candidatus Bathyarchaeota archaeon]